MKKITLALATIVKNEEANIERMLKSLKDDVDEIVLVDTGSTDRTIEVARRLGATVLERPWDNDFSAARNFALENIQSDWIIHLDADEELDVASRGRIKEVIRDSENIDAYNLLIENFGMGSIFSNLRLFKQSNKFRYIRKIHEALTSLIDDHPLIVAQSDLKIIHYGYSRDKSAMNRKDDRNEALLEAHINDDPSDLAGKYYLAAMKAENKRDVSGAMRICKEILDGPVREISIDVQTMSLYLELLAGAGQHLDVINTVRTRPELMNYNPTIAFQYALSSTKFGHLDEAIRAFDFCQRFDYIGLSFGLIPSDLKILAQENLNLALHNKKNRTRYGK